MTRQVLRRALEVIEDEAVRDEVVHGDFSRLAELSLDDGECQVVREIADKPPFGLAGHRILRHWRVSEGSRFDAAAAIADRAALLAFDRLGDALGSDSVSHDVARKVFVRGQEVDGAQLVELLGTEGVDAFIRTGALECSGGRGDPPSDAATSRLKATFGVLVAGPLKVVIPLQIKGRGDITYFGADSIGLLERAWSLAPGGRLAVELGTGTGFVSAALAPRYELVIATELMHSSASVAALTFRLNRGRSRHGRGRLQLCMTDVARGLAPGRADFVISNPPFMPAHPRDAEGRVVTYADGGPTGLELPTRFIVEGADLLAPAGFALTRCLDIAFDDGRRPLVDLCTALQAQGFSVSIEPVGGIESATFTEEIRAGGVAGDAVLSDVLVERPL
jgi:hypothetical protein